MRLTSLLATLFLVGFLSGCGQKGDLYLPDKANSGVTQAKK
ncbi:MAG: lipoprotein [Halothiobacillaceae bacterium]